MQIYAEAGDQKFGPLGPSERMFDWSVGRGV